MCGGGQDLHLDGEGFIITTYLTDKIKKGVTVYEANQDSV